MNRIIAAAAAGALAFAAIPTAAAQELPEQATDAFGATYYLNEEHSHYVTDLQEAATPFAQLNSAQQERAVAIADAAIAGLIDAGVIHDAPEAPAAPAEQPVEENYSAPAEKPIGPADVDPADPAPVASGFVKYAPVLTIGDKAYYLNADGHTYMESMERVTATPTPEEVAASEKLVTENEAEVGRQALAAARAAGDAPADTTLEAAADTRGMAAETGSNTLVRALAGLLIASVIGAAVFFFGRRRLV